MKKSQATQNNENIPAPSSSIYSKDDKISIGDFVQVIDKSNNQIIIQGQIHYQKEHGPTTTAAHSNFLTNDKRLFSTNNKYFFKLDDEAYTVKKLNIHFEDENFIKQNYKINSWSEYNEKSRDKFNLFRENTIQELDKEVVNIVHTLNKFSPKMATTGSCCGHGVSRAWISMRFEDPRTLNDFINIFEPYKYKIDLTTEEKLHPHADRFNGKPYFPRYTEMSLYTKEIGEPAYLILDELDEYLKRIIDVRTKSYDILDEMITQETIMQRRHQKDTSN